MRERDREAEEALFRFYCAALSRFSRFQALLLLAYVTCCGGRHEAHELRRRGASVREAARVLSMSHDTAARWMKEPLPAVPSWAKRALRELDEYGVEDVVEVLSEPWRCAC